MARSGRQISFMSELPRHAPSRREVDIVTLDHEEGDVIRLKFLSGSKPTAREVRLGPDVAESLLSMLSLELDQPEW